MQWTMIDTIGVHRQTANNLRRGITLTGIIDLSCRIVINSRTVPRMEFSSTKMNHRSLKIKLPSWKVN